MVIQFVKLRCYNVLITFSEDYPVRD